MRLIGFAPVSTHIGETMSLPCDCKDIYKFSICGEKLLDEEKWRKDNMIFRLKFVGDLKSATKPFNVLLACTRPLITEFADDLN